MTGAPPPPLEPDGLFDGLRWSCIIRGALLDIVLTVLGSIPLVFLLAGAPAFSDEPAAQEAVDRALSSPEGLFWGAVVGLAATVAGAYYAARRAGVHPVRHGGWVAVVSLAIGLPFMLMPDAPPRTPSPEWYDVLTLACMLPAGLLGGVLARRREA